MHLFGIVSCALVAFALISIGTCTPVSPYDRYALRSMYAAAERYNGRFVRPIRANGSGGYDYYYGHYYNYEVIFVMAYYNRPYSYYICDATAHWRRGNLYTVDTYWGCRPAPYNNNNNYYNNNWFNN